MMLESIPSISEPAALLICVCRGDRKQGLRPSILHFRVSFGNLVVDSLNTCQNVQNFLDYKPYTLLTLMYGVNLLKAPVSCVLCQNTCAISTATGSV